MAEFPFPTSQPTVNLYLATSVCKDSRQLNAMTALSETMTKWRLQVRMGGIDLIVSKASGNNGLAQLILGV